MASKIGFWPGFDGKWLARAIRAARECGLEVVTPQGAHIVVAAGSAQELPDNNLAWVAINAPMENGVKRSPLEISLAGARKILPCPYRSDEFRRFFNEIIYLA